MGVVKINMRNPGSRMISMVGLSPLLLIALILALSPDFQSNPTIHWLAQIVCSLLLAAGGFMALRRSNELGQTTLAVLGISLLGTAVIEMCFGLLLIPSMQSGVASSLIPWGWFVSRLFLVTMVILGQIVWHYEKHYKPIGPKMLHGIRACSFLAIIGACVFMTTIPAAMPEAYFSFGIFNRPFELILAVLFTVSFLALYNANDWRESIFSYNVLVCLALSIVIHALLMPFAQHNFDHLFAAASITKLASYAFVLFGLLLWTREEMRWAAEEQKVRHRAIVENARDSIITFDISGTIDTFNPAAEALFGYSAKEAVGKNINLLARSDYHEEQNEYLEKVRQSGRARNASYSYDAIGKHKDGTEIPLECAVNELDVQGAQLFTAIVRDVTERKHREDELKDLSERLALAMASGGLGSWELDLESTAVQWDQHMYRLYGVPESEAAPSYETWLERTHPEDRDTCIQALQKSVETGDPINLEFRVALPNGEERWLKTDGKLVAADSERPARLVGINRDITARKQHEHELEIARSNADEANRAKSAFLATMSHEIRTPLNGVIGMAEVLEKSELPDIQQDMTSIIRKSAASLMEIIEDILDFSKIEAGKLEIDPTPIAVGSIVEDVCAMQQSIAAGNGVEVAVFVDPEIPPTLIGDGPRLRQVLTNLVNNAIKFSGNQKRVGKVSVNAAVSKDNGERVMVEFQVSDNGIGMDHKTQNRLFNPFTQADVSTSRKFGGTGLGLTISQRLANLMQGEITVTSEPGQGSTFTATVPFSRPAIESVKESEDSSKRGAAAQRGKGAIAEREESTAEAMERDSDHYEIATTAHSREEAVRQNRLILVAEDNETNQKVIQAQLDMLGYTAEIAANGFDALKLWRSGDYSFLFTDLEMPEMDGFELVETIRAEERDAERIPIAALTANILAGEAEKCKAVGMEEYLSKPASLNDLRRVLEVWLPPLAEQSASDATELDPQEVDPQ